MKTNSEGTSMTLLRWGLIFGALCGGFGCSSKTDTGTGIGGQDQKPPAMGLEGGLGGAGTSCEPFCSASGGGTSGGGGNGAGGIPQNQICGGQAYKAEAMPVDMYIMFDQSSSMGDPLPDNSTTWWGAAQQAVTNFVNDPKAVGMTVGIQYFPLGGVAPASCTQPYSTPEVELAPLPGNAAAISKSIASHTPTAFTPTAPALTGAINHMKAWAPNHPGHAPVVVLVTDGFPTECDPQQITDIAAIANTAFTTDPIVRTFVVGFNLGQAGENLKEIATAGGTGEPFLINGGDIGSAFVAAMLSISSSPLQCSFDVPKPSDPTQKLDPDLVDVRFTPNATMVPEEVVKLNNLGDCDLNQGQGWYYDSPASPTKIMICPGTCKKFTAGTLETVSGCAPVKGITK